MPHHIWLYDVYHFLVVNNLWRAMVTWTIGVVMAHLVGLPKAWRNHIKNQNVIADRLDATTPGGLGDLRKDLQKDIEVGVEREIQKHV